MKYSYKIVLSILLILLSPTAIAQLNETTNANVATQAAIAAKDAALSVDENAIGTQEANNLAENALRASIDAHAAAREANKKS